MDPKTIIKEEHISQISLEQFYDKAYNWILMYGPRILLAVFIFVIGSWFIRLVTRWLLAGMERREMDASLRPFLQSFLVTALRVLLVLAIMQILGIEMTIFTTVIGAAGVAAGLALSGTLQNFASGILILLLKPFKAGDNIVAQGMEGSVSSIQLFYTVVTTFDNRTVIIPNSKLSNEVIINISKLGNRRLDIELKFNYGVDFEQVKAIVLEIAKSSKNILKNPAPRIGISLLEADGYRIVINVWVNAHGFQDTKLDFNARIFKELRATEIKLPGTEAA